MSIRESASPEPPITRVRPWWLVPSVPGFLTFFRGRERRRVPWIPIVIITVMLAMALFAPLLAPYSPIDQTLRDKLLPPFWVEGGSMQYPLGTDAFGRDLLRRLLYGALVSFLVAPLALTPGARIGPTIGI